MSWEAHMRSPLAPNLCQAAPLRVPHSNTNLPLSCPPIEMQASWTLRLAVRVITGNLGCHGDPIPICSDTAGCIF